MKISDIKTLNVINKNLETITGYNLTGHAFSYTLTSREKNLIRALGARTNFQQWLLDHELDEREFFIEMSTAIAEHLNDASVQTNKVFKKYMLNTEEDNKYLYLFFMSDELDKDIEFWQDIIQLTSSYELLIQLIKCIPENLKSDILKTNSWMETLTTSNEENHNTKHLTLKKPKSN